MLESFLASHSANSEIWIRYRELIALDMGLSSLNVHDNDLWDQTPQLPSFSKQGALVKLARWFSWNEVRNEMLAEYHAFTMVLEDSLDLDDESKPSSVLPRSVPTAQGPSMNEDLHFHSHILLEVTRPLWSWYAAEIQSVKFNISAVHI